jgi:hypothetical protein
MLFPVNLMGLPQPPSLLKVDLTARNGSLEALRDLVSDEFKADHK